MLGAGRAAKVGICLGTRNSSVLQKHMLRIGIDIHNIAEQNTPISRPAQNTTQRRGDFSWLQRSIRSLVKQRLEKVIVSPIKLGYIHHV
jgi:hypothetical protein